MKTSGLVLRIIFFIVSAIYGLLTIVCGIVSALSGLAFSFVDLIGSIFNGVDGTFFESTYSFIIVIVSIALFLAALLIPILGAITLFLFNGEHYGAISVLYKIICILAGSLIIMELLICVWMLNVNIVYNVPEFSGLQFIWPAVSVLFVIALIVLSIFSLSSARKEDEYFTE